MIGCRKTASAGTNSRVKINKSGTSFATEKSGKPSTENAAAAAADIYQRSSRGDTRYVVKSRSDAETSAAPPGDI